MRLAGRDIPLQAAMWFALLAAPSAWVVQFLVGFAFDLAQCNAAGREWQLPVDAWTIAATAFGAVLALAGGFAAIGVWRATKDAGEAELPGSRIHFLAVVALTTTPLFLAIILMSGLGATFLPDCHQS